jgi:hypothetical protein
MDRQWFERFRTAIAVGNRLCCPAACGPRAT